MSVPRSTRSLLLIAGATAALSLAMGALPKGAVRRIPFDIVPTTGLFEPALSDNGRWLAFRTGATNMIEGGNDSSTDIFLADLKKGAVIQVSRTMGGGDPTLSCVAPAINPNGRFVAYQSSDTGIVPGDTPGSTDLFLFDAKKGTTVRISETLAGGGGAGVSTDGAISKNGRWVAFSSNAPGLVQGDLNGQRDVFLRDVKMGVTTILSLTSTGAFATAESEDPVISANGRFVAFASEAALIPEDTNGDRDVYLADVKKGTLTLVSVNDQGVIGDADSGSFLDISANGRYVSFTSGAQNLVPEDVAFANVFRRDVKKGITQLASSSAAGVSGGSVSTSHDLSPDGRYVAFQSFSNDLGIPDGNIVDDIYLKDMNKGSLERISLGFGGVETDDTSSAPVLSKGAKFVAFQSLATTLLEEMDGNAGTDVFVKRR